MSGSIPLRSATASASLLRQSISRSCFASTSRTAVRSYASSTEQETLPGSSGSEFTYGTTTSKTLESAYIRKHRGKGFPAINSLRNRVSVHHSWLYRKGHFSPLTIPFRQKAGRNHTGRITAKGRGGGKKRRLRRLDFYRYFPGVHDVVRIEYDPGRSGHIALIRRRYGTEEMTDEEKLQRMQEVDEADRTYKMPAAAKFAVKGGWSYILAPDGLRAGDTVQSFRRGIPDGFVEGWKNKIAEGEEVSTRAMGLLRTVVLKIGNVLPLYLIPPGTIVHNLSFASTGRMGAARSAGTSAQIVAHHTSKGEAIGGLDILKMGHQYDEEGYLSKQEGYVLVRMTSGEVRKFSPGCCAAIGLVSNKEYSQINVGKAGRRRLMGFRPRVRGAAMNSVDHPHGGGKGKGKGGKQGHHWAGWVTKGVRTRRPFPRNKRGNRMVVTQRPRGPHSGAKRR